MPSNAPEQTQKKPRLRALRWALRFLAVAALLVVLLSLATYLSRDWLISKATNTLTAKLNHLGVYLEVAGTEISPIRGIVLKEVTAFSDPEKSSPVMSISDLAIAVNPFRRTEENGLFARITSDSASFTAHRSEEAISLTEVDLTLYVSGHQLRITQLKAQGAGTTFDVSADIALESKTGAEEADDKPTTPVTEGILDNLNLEPVAKILSILATQSNNDAPVVKAHLDFPATGPPTVKGSFTGKKFTWRNTPFDAVDIDLDITPEKTDSSSAPEIRTIKFPSLDLLYKGKTLSASGAYLLDTDTVKLDSFTSQLDLFSFFSDLVPATASSFKGFRMETPPSVSFSGTFPIENPQDCVLKGTVANGAFGIATENKRELLITNTSCTFDLSAGTLHTPDIKANLFGGVATADIKLLPFQAPVHFTGSLTIKEASLNEVASHFGGKAGGPGQIDATFTGSGNQTLPSLTGSGHVHLYGASSVSLPVVKAMTTTIQSVIPRLKHSDKSTSITANYTIEGGIISTNDIELTSGALAVDGTARINLEKGYVQSTASARTSGAAGFVTALAGQALAMEGEGPFGAIQWRFKNLPNLRAGDAAGAVVGGAKGVGQTVGSGTGAVIDGAKGVGETAGGLIKGLRGIIPKPARK